MFIAVGCGKSKRQIQLWEHIIVGTYESDGVASRLVFGEDKVVEIKGGDGADVETGSWNATSVEVVVTMIEEGEIDEKRFYRIEKSGDLTFVAFGAGIKGEFKRIDLDKSQFITYKKIKEDK